MVPSLCVKASLQTEVLSDVTGGWCVGILAALGISRRHVSAFAVRSAAMVRFRVGLGHLSPGGPSVLVSVEASRPHAETRRLDTCDLGGYRMRQTLSNGPL